MLRLLAPLAVLLGLIGAVVLSDPPKPRADFVFVNRGELSTLDLVQMSWQQDFRAARLLYEGLTRQAVFRRDFRAEPAVAESWEISPDARMYTFRLRADARWSNGDPVRARDFVTTFRRGLLPENGADYLKLYQLVKGGAAFSEKRAADLKAFATLGEAERGGAAGAEAMYRQTLQDFETMVGLRTPDDRTLVVELERPTPFFLDLAAFPSFYPVHTDSILAAQTIDPQTGAVRTDPNWTKAERLRCNGPFTLESWRFKREMRYRKNPYYWDRDRIAIETIATPSIGDTNAQILAFRTGAVDWVVDATPAYLPEMLRQKREFEAEHREELERLTAAGFDTFEIVRRLPFDPRNLLHTDPSFGTYFYTFNCSAKLPDGRVNPFADARVRRAFAMTIDKTPICDNIRRSGEPPASTLIPPGSIAGYQSPAGLSFDPAEARRLMAEAGYPGGEGFITVEILINSEGFHELIAQAVAADWQRHLGVAVRLDKKEIKIFREQVKQGNYIVTRASWFGDYNDPLTFLEIAATGDGNNDGRYSSATYDALLEKLRGELRPAERFALARAAEQHLLEVDAPLAPIFRWNQISLYDPRRFTGLSAHPRQIQFLGLIDRLGDGVGPDAVRMMELSPTDPQAGQPR